MFQLSEEPGYVLYSALGSFYIPSCIMVFVYINIYFAARSAVRQSFPVSRDLIIGVSELGPDDTSNLKTAS